VFIDFLTGAGVLSLGTTTRVGGGGHEPAEPDGLDLPAQAKDSLTNAQLSMLPGAVQSRIKVHLVIPIGRMQWTRRTRGAGCG
jgi:diaminobutyrate-2-oxoglutarate transaminase